MNRLNKQSINRGAMDRCKNIIGLDLDGVISDTWLSRLRYENPSLNDPRLLSFIRSYPQLFKEGMLREHDVKGIQVDSLIYLVKMAQETESGFVLVSSWAHHHPNAYCAVDELCRYLTGFNFTNPLFIGQTSGVSGEDREKAFLNWLEVEAVDFKAKGILAIDDSGEKHFPKMTREGKVVKPVGRNGFVMDDYIRCLRKLNHNDGNWFEWADQGYLDDCDVPKTN